MSDGSYLAAEQMPEGLDRWQTVEVYGESWGCHQRAGSWKRWLASSLKPWHVWRYEAPIPVEELMAEAATVRERMNVGALKGNGFYVDRADYDESEVE